MLRALMDFNYDGDGVLAVGRPDREIADLEALGASRHQIYRLRRKVAGGANLGVEVAALKARLERGLYEDIRAMAAVIEKRAGSRFPAGSQLPRPREST
jgi:hypothetical protein